MSGLDYDAALGVLRALKVQRGNDEHALLMAREHGEGFGHPSAILGISVTVNTDEAGLFVIHVNGDEVPAVRWCYWIDEVQDPKQYGGYIASIVTEGEPGHTPIPGGSKDVPGVWGYTLQEAQDEAAEQNAKLRLSPGQVVEIRLSSMRVSNVGVPADE